METIFKGKEIELRWKVISRTTKEPVDFEAVEGKVFIIGPDNKYVKPFSVVRDTFRGLSVSIDTAGLSTGVYDAKVVWLNDSLAGKNDYRNVSVKRNVFAVSDIPSEITTNKDVINIITNEEVYGKDGMSAYEIAIMRGIGIGTLSEKEWITQLSQHVVDEVAEAERKSSEAIRIAAEDARIKSEANRIAAEDARIKSEEERNKRMPIIRFNEAKGFEVSYDEGYSWSSISDPIPVNLHIKKHVATVDYLPPSEPAGTIYAVGTEMNYILYVKREDTTWAKHGPLNGISAGIVQDIGDNQDVVMSQRATSLQVKNVLESGTRWIGVSKEATVDVSGTDIVDATYAVSVIDSLIDSVDSVFMEGGCTLSFIKLTRSYIYLGFYFYDDIHQVYTQDDFNGNSKFNTSVSLEELRGTGYKLCVNRPYSAKALRIKFNGFIENFCSSMPDGAYVSYEARYINSVKPYEDGLKMVDVTNRLFTNKPAFNAGHNDSANIIFAINDGIIAFDGDDRLVYSLQRIYRDGDTIKLVMRAGEGLIDSNSEQYIAETKDEGISRVRIADFYRNSSPAYITIDTEMFGDNFDHSFRWAGESPVFIPVHSMEAIKTRKDYSGYFTRTGLVSDANYSTFILPLNSECDYVDFYGEFDKNANVAIAKDSGAIWGWGLTNADGSKYEGEETYTYLRVHCKGFKYLAASIKKTDIAHLKVYAHHYDYSKAIDSFNAFRYSRNSEANIGLFNSVKDEKGNVITGGGNAYASEGELQYSVVSNKFAGEGWNTPFKDSALLEVGHYTRSRYYAGVQRTDGSNYPVIWKEDADTLAQTEILSGGMTPPVPEGSEFANYKFSGEYAKDNVAITTMIKELDDKELLIGILLRHKTTNERKYVIFRTSNAQTVWNPKFVTSNENYIVDGGVNFSVGYPTKNNSIHYEFMLPYSRKMILISEYGNGTPKYWNDKNISKNGNGISGKVWLSIDNGETFYKIFDLDEKIDKNPNNTAAGNWRWVKSYEGRMSAHIHGCYIDKINEKIWVTNGDSQTVDGFNSLFYIDILTVIQDILAKKLQATDANDLSPKYNGEYLPAFNNFIMQEYVHNGNPSYANVLTHHATYQTYCMFPSDKTLILGNDTERQLIYGIHRSTISQKSNDAGNMKLDIFHELDKKNPSSEIVTFPQQIIRRDAASPILMLWNNKGGVWASFDGAEWAQIGYYKNMIGFTSYAVKDLDDKYIIVNPNVSDDSLDGINYLNVKLLNY